MKITLAPMQGVIDHHMRHILTTVGGYDQCVTEFVRVTDQLLPGRVFRRLCPELASEGRTAAGTPVVVQLLGGVPEAMAANARRAVELGAFGIDINFGCPSKLVNRNAGGAVLLKEPRRLHDIVHAVRCAVPDGISVSAKVRLGYDNTDLALDNAHAVQDAGADFICVHARTKVDGYKAPARWEWLAVINAALKIRVIANGDITSVDDYLRCREVSGCEDVMIGRGAVARPDLARQIKRHRGGVSTDDMQWCAIHALVLDLAARMKASTDECFVVPRVKQWLAMLRHEHAEALHMFERIRALASYSEVETLLRSAA